MSRDEIRGDRPPKIYNLMNDFIFYSPTKFIFGREAVDAAGGELLQRSFRKALIVYGGASAVKSGVLSRVQTVRTRRRAGDISKRI